MSGIKLEVSGEILKVARKSTYFVGAPREVVSLYRNVGLGFFVFGEREFCAQSGEEDEGAGLSGSGRIGSGCGLEGGFGDPGRECGGCRPSRA